MTRQPVLFIGHGSPMNVISENKWTHDILEFGKKLYRPEAIVVISAHWQTDGIKIHSSPQPKTIHDFRGFPQKLHEVQYPAPSNHNIVERIQKLLPEAHVTNDWGFDHGTWGVLAFLRPQADVPVIPISLNARNNSRDLFDLGQKLKILRDENILIVGSGNLVHNLYEINFRSENAVFPWAEKFDSLVKELTQAGELQKLLSIEEYEAQQFKHAHPTSEHWAPYVVCLGAADEISNVSWIHEGLQNGSISMRSAEWK